MIELPASPAPNGVTPRLIDYGSIERPPLGGELTRIDRAGSRFAVEISWPAMTPDTAGAFVARLLRAKRQGLTIPFPLLGRSQGFPGNTAFIDHKLALVTGAGQSGTTLAMQGMVPGYEWKEGYGLSPIDATGRVYLHCCLPNTIVNGSGNATIEIEPPLRAPLPDGAFVLVSKPVIQGSSSMT